MAVIDAHAHIYPDKIAPKAVEAVGDFYNVGMFGDGTADGLLAAKDRAPITHFIVHSVATTAHAVTAINDFIAKQCQAHPEFIGFAAMQQDFEDPAAELQRAVELGLRGVKLHPDTQKVNMDDPRLMEVYAICEQLGLPEVIHAPAPPGEHPAHVPRPGSGRGAFRLLVALRGGLRHPARGGHERSRVP